VDAHVIQVSANNPNPSVLITQWMAGRQAWFAIGSSRDWGFEHFYADAHAVKSYLRYQVTTQRPDLRQQPDGHELQLRFRSYLDWVAARGILVRLVVKRLSS
jgi:hypothetical protein